MPTDINIPPNQNDIVIQTTTSNSIFNQLVTGTGLFAPTGGAIKESGESSLFNNYSNIKNSPQGGTTTAGYNTSSETSTDNYSNEEYCPLYWTPPPLRILQTHDKTNFIFFTDETFYQNSKITLVRDINANINYSISNNNANQGDSMLWCSSSRSYEVFYVDGKNLGQNIVSKNDGLKEPPYLLPVFFMSGASSLGYQPSVLEFDITYDDDTKMADLLFWANEFIDPYYTKEDRSSLENSNNRNSLFYSKGSYKLIEVTSSKKFIVNTFIFSYPVRVFSGNLGLSTNITDQELFQ
jgi:hypothetical protein